MSAALYEAALRELQSPAPVGKRHAQVVRLACLLRAAGWSAAATFHRLRVNYDPATLLDSEISGAIEWAQKQIQTRCGRPIPSAIGFPRIHTKPNSSAHGFSGKNPKPLAGDSKLAIEQFLAGFACAEVDLFDASPVSLSPDFRKDAELAFQCLYSPLEKLNIVTRYGVESPGGIPQKCFPLGFGETISRNEWLCRFRNNLIPESSAGAWLRINPVNGAGISDEHVCQFRFALVESDFLPVEIQIALIAKLPIPISAILTSGGKSLHAWARIEAGDLQEYREKISRLFALVVPLGFDASNKNPSRLSRLPGAQRIIGAVGDGKQRLIYLNPENNPKFPIL